MFYLVSSFLHSVDRFGTPLNLKHNGISVFKTKLGGLSSLAILATILAFSYVRLQKLIGLSDPILYEVTQALDLINRDTEDYRLWENNVTLGVFGTVEKFQVSEDSYSYQELGFDLTQLFDIVFLQQEMGSGYQNWTTVQS